VWRELIPQEINQVANTFAKEGLNQQMKMHIFIKGNAIFCS